jgi:hypothetical protein
MWRRSLGRRRSPLTRVLGWEEEGAGGSGEKNELRLAWVSARGFLIGRNPRAAVDLDRTVAVEPRIIGLL